MIRASHIDGKRRIMRGLRDEIVATTSFSATRAITIDASPQAVWPWIAELGFGRAGFQSYDLFDNAGRPSATRILPEFQHPQVGEWVPMANKVNESTAFRIKALVPGEWMLWERPNSTWVWTLTPLDGGRTRLITRLEQCSDWGAPAMALVTVILDEFGDFPMMRKLLLGVKARAEAHDDTGGREAPSRRQADRGGGVARRVAPDPYAVVAGASFDAAPSPARLSAPSSSSSKRTSITRGS